MKIKALVSSTALFLLPFVVAAQAVDTSSTAPGNLSAIKSLVGSIGQLVAMLIPILIGLALIVFFWGLVRYVWGAGKGHEQGRKIMIAGLISLFVMVSVWGIVRLAQVALGVSTITTLPGPSLPTY